MKSAFAVLLVLVAAVPAPACSFCGDGFTRRQTMRERFAEAKAVFAGRLQNPVARDDGTGTTEFHLTHVLKGDAAAKVLTIPRYLPVVADTPPDYVFFFAVTDGRLDATDGVPGGKAVVEYLTGLAKLDPKAVDARLRFAFRHLDSADAAASADAFLEVARAGDADLVRVKADIDRKKLRDWIANPKTPDERVGVYGLLLGLCGDKRDAVWLRGELSAAKPSERVLNNLGGLLTGLILLDPDIGWTVAGQILASAVRSFSDKLNVLSSLRFFQATRPRESKPQILDCLKAMIGNADLADLAIDDLRRWQWWDLTDAILACYAKPTHAAPAVRRGIVRYALQCPDAAAKAFTAGLRTTDPELVKKVEDGLKLYEKK